MAENSYLSESEQAARLAAQRATGERWFLYLHGGKPPYRVSVGYQDIKPERQATLFPLDRDGHFSDDDAAFICLTDPAFVLSVLARLEKALKENERLTGVARWLEERIEELNGDALDLERMLDERDAENEQLKEEIVELGREIQSLG